ncbi:GGDEF domain-containing response regulator [Desulfomonile tiedjei]|uniref:diguanylate cyclase n=1 Tax=Desulfomonile tiedjei (strain ATCC 49306 / DSM 6799 / DCB-1) TaxID=706587 RepID=I4C0D9_DESTA|nr:diguanylate cyclase [Desulfomonile tiedjei]AFM23030.1 diguanylate cyclase (GGDEF) domain-containing protein [Desulfomonile tiedjei DSM 6799]
MKVLVAEDNRFFRRLVEASLQQWGHEVLGCEDGSQAWDLLMQDAPPRLALLDWEMPKLQGIEICRRLRALKDRPYVYLILLTAKSRKDDIIKGLDSGADDYVTKPFDPVELRVRLRAATRILELQEDLMAACQAAEQRAQEDSLTGLWNHSAILDILRKELDRSARSGGNLGVILADVDYFKRINDSYGHLVGDRVLRSIGRAMRENLRSHDSIGRYGGEEFLVVLPDCCEGDLISLAERLRKAILDDCARDTQKVLRTMSFGCTCVDGKVAMCLDAIVHAADEALYRAKKNGRNRIEVQLVATDSKCLDVIN